MRNLKNWILREPVKNHSRIDEEPFFSPLRRTCMRAFPVLRDSARDDVSSTVMAVRRADYFAWAWASGWAMEMCLLPQTQFLVSLSYRPAARGAVT